jgi:hypothetical protein
VKLDSKSRNSEAARRGEKPSEWCSFGSVPPYIGVRTVFRIGDPQFLYTQIFYMSSILARFFPERKYPRAAPELQHAMTCFFTNETERGK